VPVKPLRTGYTTGACAAAAARAAARMLRTGEPVTEIDLLLPTGDRAVFSVQGQQYDELSASCHVVKDAGDDPDVTNGAEIHVTLRREQPKNFRGQTMVFVLGGEGVGRVTKPGLAAAVGEPAINPVPLRMITAAVKEEFAVVCLPQIIYVTVSIPNGAELAKKTLNERLGIIGGLSILGTTGIVKPISAAAWTDTIDAAISVALACDTHTVVLSTGRTSELEAQTWYKGNLAEESFVMMGDYVGHALHACLARGVPQVVLAGQFAKLLKIACGHQQTHVSSAELDLQMLVAWLADDAETAKFVPLAQGANTARQLLVESGNDPALIRLVCSRAQSAAGRLAPGLLVKVLLAGYNSEILHYTDW